MYDLKNSINEHIKAIDRLLNFKLYTERTLLEWFKPLLDSLTDDGAVPYLIGKQERFRASPLASTIIWLNDAGLLPEPAIDCMQDKLLDLRDNSESIDSDKGILKKYPEDSEGWSLAEGVSIWSTSLAIIALTAKQEIGIKKANLYNKSILWLVKQQKVESGGWAYQFNDNCVENPVMTSLALRALAVVQKKISYFKFTADEERNIIVAIKNGYEYMKQNMKYNKKKDYIYWCFNEKPHYTSTVWGLIALQELSEIENCGVDVKEFFKENVVKGTNFVLSCMPRGKEAWKNEQLVCEGGAKYNKQKNYYSFSATLLPQLFDLGVSPYHPKVITQITWLIKNPDEWKIKNYDKGQICVFTYAMIISTLVRWGLLIGQENSKNVVQECDKIVAKINSFLFGAPTVDSSPVQVVQKNRIWYLTASILLIIILICFGKTGFICIKNVITSLLDFWSNSKKDIVVNMVSTAIYAIIIAIVVGIFNKIKKMIRRNRY